MSVELVIRGPEKRVRSETPELLARLFHSMDAAEKECRSRHAREVARILSLADNAGERGFWRAD